MWCCVVLYGAVRCSAVLCCALLYSVVLCGVILLTLSLSLFVSLCLCVSLCLSLSLSLSSGMWRFGVFVLGALLGAGVAIIIFEAFLTKVHTRDIYHTSIHIFIYQLVFIYSYVHILEYYDGE